MVGPQDAVSHLVRRLHHVMVVVPVDRHVDEGEEVGGEERKHRHHRREVRLRGELQLQHHDGHHDRDDAIGESIHTARTHGIPPRLVAWPTRYSLGLLSTAACARTHFINSSN